jgi:hypothetical protein
MDRRGEVVGGDDADLPQRVPDLEHRMVRALRWQYLSRNLSTHPHSKITDINKLLDFAHALCLDLAHLQRHQGPKIILMLTKLHANLANNLSTLWCGSELPLLFCLQHVRQARLIVISIAKLNTSNSLTSCRINCGVSWTIASPFFAIPASKIVFFQTKSLKKRIFVISKSRGGEWRSLCMSEGGAEARVAFAHDLLEGHRSVGSEVRSGCWWCRIPAIPQQR